MKDFISERPIKKKYFTHTEIGNMINEHSSTVNFWAKELKIKRKKSWKWLYERETVAKFHLIKDLLRNQDWTLHRLKIKFNAI